MIYATDLDRTLIYSQTFIDINKENKKIARLRVDESKVDSYISKRVLSSLTKLLEDNRVKFIPVTTRSLSEYNRILIPGVTPEYAIVSNGGTILYRNNILKEWTEYLSEKIRITELKEIAEEIQKLSSISYETRIIDSVYIFTKSDNIEKTEEELSVLRGKYKDYKFYTYKNKVYGIPKVIGKDIALNWLKQYLSEDFIVCSGDSIFDTPMFKVADVVAVPSHNTLSSSELLRVKARIVTGGMNSPLSTIKIIRDILNQGEYCYGSKYESDESRQQSAKSE